ncbi:unnamed protein product [Lactuca virosa]|uniref:Uncharacterized protein n=1 Tax=Lactuca virosa TaxID=75947 RepID=A0AAU9NZX3_9ASTR|nr:unnamed protein product [Lactuca virosa]
MNGGLFSRQSNKRLTWRSKLRHVTMEDFCASGEDDASNRSKSLPFSPIPSQNRYTGCNNTGICLSYPNHCHFLTMNSDFRPKLIAEEMDDLIGFR